MTTLTYNELLDAVNDPTGRPITNPATGETVGQTYDGSPADMDQAVTRARAAQPD